MRRRVAAERRAGGRLRQDRPSRGTGTGKAGVCFKPPAGQNFTDMQSELEKLLELGVRLRSKWT